jgi:hypothetical protein
VLFGVLFAWASRSNEYDILAYRMHPGTLPMVGVVHEAFQPTQVSMWLAEAGSGHDTGSVRG